MRTLAVSWILVVVFAGCSGDVTPAKPKKKQYAGDRFVNLDELTFADPALEKEFRRTDAAVRKIADADGLHHIPYHWLRGARQVYKAQWSKNAPFREEYHGPNHCFELHLRGSREEPAAIERLDFLADWKTG